MKMLLALLVVSFAQYSAHARSVVKDIPEGTKITFQKGASIPDRLNGRFLTTYDCNYKVYNGMLNDPLTKTGKLDVYLASSQSGLRVKKNSTFVFSGEIPAEHYLLTNPAYLFTKEGNSEQSLKIVPVNSVGQCIFTAKNLRDTLKLLDATIE